MDRYNGRDRAYGRDYARQQTHYRQQERCRFGPNKPLSELTPAEAVRKFVSTYAKYYKQYFVEVDGWGSSTLGFSFREDGAPIMVVGGGGVHGVSLPTAMEWVFEPEKVSVKHLSLVGVSTYSLFPSFVSLDVAQYADPKVFELCRDAFHLAGELAFKGAQQFSGGKLGGLGRLQMSQVSFRAEQKMPVDMALKGL